MHTLRLEIDDSIYTTIMNFLQKLPKEKCKVEDETNSLSFEEAKAKVAKAIEGTNKNSALDIDEAFAKVLSE